MKTLKDFDVKNKRVLVRCDFNVPLDENGNILDDFRIQQTIPTIEYLIKRGAKIILMSHLGNPAGSVKENLRLTPVQDKLLEYLDVRITKSPDCVGRQAEKWSKEMKPGEILLLENLRFHKEEKENDDKFAKELSKLGDIYINDAFGACHRAHASVALVPKYLPSAAGLLLEKEIKVLSKVLTDPWRPFVAVIGGIKISSKIKVIEQFLKISDHVLLGGDVANTVLAAKGILLGKPLPEPEVMKKIERIDLTNPKLHLPLDGIISLAEIKDGFNEGYARTGAIGQVRREEKAYDIGPETIEVFSNIIKDAKMIILSGPPGMFEQKQFEKGTKEIAKAISKNYNAFKIAGGGETDSALRAFGLRDKFDHVSTGGGAMLGFLAGEKMPGIEALK